MTEDTEFTRWVLREMEKSGLKESDLLLHGISLDALRQAQYTPTGRVSESNIQLSSALRMTVLIAISDLLGMKLSSVMQVYKVYSSRSDIEPT